MYWTQRGFTECQHKGDGTFKESIELQNDGKRRHFTLSMFYCIHERTKEKYERSWLCYTKSSGSIFCFVCRLMSSTVTKFTTGYKDWRNAHDSISNHERSRQHFDSTSALCARNTSGQIDSSLVEQYLSEVSYWKELLRRVISVVKFLSSRGLAFRGKDELIVSTHKNNGNYHGILELLAQYDSFLAEHISKYANKGSGHTFYISSTICDEIINLMGQQVLKIIVDEIKEAKYFSISVDSTPDLTHTDQLTFVIRYVRHNGPIERFLKFIPMYSRTRVEIAHIILKFLAENGIDIRNCRG